jgi:hypothetical protein
MVHAVFYKKMPNLSSLRNMSGKYWILLAKFMKLHHNILAFWIFLFITLAIFQSNAIAQNIPDKKIPDTYCLNEDELQLFNLLNRERQQKGLPKLELSKSLSYVAYLHVRDLYINRPDTVKGCNMHSWSSKGQWTPFCYPRDQTKRRSIWDKPKEITLYPGSAFEVVYYSEDKTGPVEIIELWKGVTPSAALIFNTGKYMKNHWKSAGVSIYKGYASLWLGESKDPETKIRLCSSDSVINSVVSKPSSKSNITREDISQASLGQYYLIFGSYPNFQLARQAQIDLINDGFKNAFIFEKEGKFRTALDKYETMEAARAAKKQLPNKYKNAWILKE